MTAVLIVEDEPLIAFSLSQIIADATGAEVIVATTVADADKHLVSEWDFVLLDVNVRGETTYALARQLASNGVPFAFASGSSRANIPEDLGAATFLAKPCRARVVISAVREALLKSESRACSGH